MVYISTNWDRRREMRRASAGRLFWHRPGRSIRYLAYMSNKSVGSVSFITPSIAKLRLGERVEIAGVADAECGYFVTRIETYGARMSLVACRSLIARRRAFQH